MFFSLIHVSIFLAIPAATLAAPSTYAPNISTQTSFYPSGPCPWTHEPAITHEQVVENYLKLWGGDYTYLDKTVVPTFSLWQDRFPMGNYSATFPINNSTDMLHFIQAARSKFEHYEFIRQLSFGVENMVVLRWTLNATWGGSEHSTVPKGTPVAYNGTDWALLDPCTGKMQQVLSAQDAITFAHVTGQAIGVV